MSLKTRCTLNGYVPDAAEVRNELGTDEVKAKTEAGALWCKHACDHARTHGTKPWKYLLIPHDQVTEDKRLIDYLSFEVR